MKISKIIVVILSSLSVWLSAWAAQSTKPNVNDEGVILGGYDAVSYFKSDQPQKGLSQFQVKNGESVFWFKNDENKQIFIKDPDKFKPQFDGWCAYAVADSKSKVEIDPKKFVIQDNRLFVFYNGFFGDTRSKWNKDTKAFLKKADQNWPETKTKEP